LKDFQRKRVYDADADVSDGKLFTFAGVGLYVQRVLRSKWWQKRCAIREIELSTKTGIWYDADRKSSKRGFIRIAQKDEGSWTERDIVHELAHVFCKPSKDPDNNHGRHWARAYYDLTRRYRGKQVARELVAAFLKHGVRCEPPPNLKELF